MDALLMSELSADTLAALQAHLIATQPVENADNEVSEDFRLSQLYAAVMNDLPPEGLPPG